MSTKYITETIDDSYLDPNRVLSVELVGENRRLGTVASSILNPFSPNANKLIPNAIDLEGFFQVASDIIDVAQEKGGIVEAERIRLVKEYQPEAFYTFENGVIATRLLSREPANLSKDGQSRPQRAVIPFADTAISQRPNEIIQLRARPIDQEIEFQCWSKSNTLADKYALWLERLFNSQTYIFKMQGADRFLWLRRGTDAVWKQGEQMMHFRSLIYFVRLYEYDLVAHPAIRRVDIQFKQFP